MNPDDEQIIAELRRQVELEGSYTERQCGEQLKHIPWVLLSPFDGTITYVDCEQVCSAGRVDMLIIADVLQVDGMTHPEAFVWELKAPQLHLFQIETENRATPTNDFFKAEDQLLHYYDSVRKSGHLQRRWGILPDDVKMGGLIIGQNSTFVRCRDTDSLLAHNLAKQALDIRESMLYRSHNIRIWTWDRVLSIAETPTFSFRRMTEQPVIDYDITTATTLSGSTGIIDTLPPE